ncbi:NADH/Ubiquinone/plastoquinone (complex I) [Isosphaera pallida ATCC 43644]|uniref:Probable inorganic carbon transporter subunit DabB n=1 Tax=Isosphaera pallida (strain ATCC 43644 / DSM 9630 / IS1B) TaxID=575540 RepID=E8R1W7_ISOPI|nr:proton-conducting transporter membrane subunit [Isosphaera pallida]ADV61389.1 NADH/Ubiquinone/plastoquinone (complex I) [Isosphaera pallida ATCC 43644]
MSDWEDGDRASLGWDHGPRLALLVGLTLVSAAALVGQLITPGAWSGFGITLDPLSAMLTLLVSGIGTVTLVYSVRYLEGHPARRRFLRLLTFTVVSAYILMCSTHLVLLFVAWAATSLGLHGLLTIDPRRREAIRPARKKFLISRLGDLALVGAIALIYQSAGTFDLNQVLAHVGTIPASEMGPIAMLVAIAALTKSAQFPFHSWLPETMEAPTPVSALMHAGIINAGGALVIRFAPLIARVPEALLLLSVVGTLTLTLGMLTMWAQVKIKRILAWSTVSQMGFMMIQCGLGAFPAAALHIVGHGCYKAWSFLRCGEVPRSTSSNGIGTIAPGRALALVSLGTLAALPGLTFASWLIAFSWWDAPGELALGMIVALSCGQLWVSWLGGTTAGFNRSRLLMVREVFTTMGLTLALCVCALGLYRGATLYLTPTLGPIAPATGPLAWIAAGLPVAAMVALTVIHALLPVIGRASLGRAFHVHALNGFYWGAVADRVVDALCGSPRCSSPPSSPIPSITSEARRASFR